MIKIAVLIPCFNEEKTVGTVVKDFRKALPEATVFVYNNNSTDNSVKIAEKNGAVIKNVYMQGKGQVVRRAFQEIDADCYIMVDADDTYSAKSARKMVDLVVKKNADMVVGDRLSSTYFQENKRPFHNTGNSLVRICINRFFKSNISDIMTGYRAFSRRFVKTFPVTTKGFEIETEMSIHAIAMNMQIENIVIEYKDRPEGSKSKLNTYKDGAKVLLTILRLYKNYRPFSLFTTIATILLLIDAVVLTLSVFIPYAQSGLVENFPTLIVGCFVALVALQLCVCGLILESIWQKERREFEYRLMTVCNDPDKNQE